MLDHPVSIPFVLMALRLWWQQCRPPCRQERSRVGSLFVECTPVVQGKEAMADAGVVQQCQVATVL